MEISVFGLGYVGLISSVCLAEQGHTVVGVDIAKDKVDQINQGNTPIQEPGLKERFLELRNNGSFRATKNPSEALEETNISMICVGTPSGSGGKLSLRSVENVSRQIGQTLKGKNEPHTIILRSTVLPGTSDKVIRWLKKASERSLPGDLEFYYQPEFMREGNAIEDFYNPPFTVYGSAGEPADDFFRELYPDVSSEIHPVELAEAEFIKYVCNAFHALKIGFANEIGRFSRNMDIDGRKIMDLVCRDTKLNISSKYLEPGFAFGGSCLPKDVRALVHKAEEEFVSLPLLEHILPSNQDHLAHAKDLVNREGSECLSVIGIRFKEGTDDLRESPMLKLLSELLEEGFRMKWFDPLLDTEAVHGSNQLFVEDVLADYEELMVPDLEQLLSFSSTVLIGTREEKYRSKLLQYEDRNITLFDFPGLFQPHQVPETWDYHGICW